MEGLELWNKVEKTDPAHTKKFTKGGGFSGTAIKPIYLIKKATEIWGPAGAKWGWQVAEEKIINAAPMKVTEGIVAFEQLHSVRIKLYYPVSDDKTGVVESYGHTILSGARNNGNFYTDDEAPKKSLTDAIGKALHYLGFSADVYFGEFDGSKYEDDKDPSLPPVSTEERLEGDLQKSIDATKDVKSIDEAIEALTELDAEAGTKIMARLETLPPALRERRKQIMREKVKKFGWTATKTGNVVTFAIPSGGGVA
jgi:hypothetical protein